MKKFGTTKLHLGLVYIGLTPEHETAQDIPSLSVRVPLGPKKVVEIPFAKVTTKQLELAIDILRRKPTPHDDELTSYAKSVHSVLQAEVAAPKGSHRHAPGVRAYPHPDGQRAVRFDLLGVDLDDIVRGARALVKVRLPKMKRATMRAVA